MSTLTFTPNGTRPPDDFYPTQPELVTAALLYLLRFADLPAAPRILDPGCGGGPWGSIARQVWPEARILGVDVVAGRVYEARQLGLYAAYDGAFANDFLTWRYAGPPFDLIIGNPPYGDLAERFLHRSWALLKPGGWLLFLLLQSFISTQGRYDRLYADGRRRPARYVILPERPSFSGDGKTDQREYALYYWHKGWYGQTMLDWLKYRHLEAAAPDELVQLALGLDAAR